MTYELLYTSVATKEMSSEDLVELLKKSHENNEKTGVTGMLIYHNGSFIQLLEGDKDAVKKLFSTISEDERHQNVYVFYEGDVSERHFANWSMGFKNTEDIDREELEGFSDFLDSGFSQEILEKDPSIGQKLLLTMRNAL